MRLATIVTAGSLRLTNPSARKVSSNAVVMIAISSGEKTPLPKRRGRIGIAPTPQPQVFYHINGGARNAKKLSRGQAAIRPAIARPVKLTRFRGHQLRGVVRGRGLPGDFGRRPWVPFHAAGHVEQGVARCGAAARTGVTPP